MDTHTNQTEVYLSSKEAGQILGYTHDYISRLCRQGHMVGVRRGREWFVKPSDLEVFKQKHELILQEKKVELSQKLSQIRKKHEAQKRALKQGISSDISNQISQTQQEVIKDSIQDVQSYKNIPRNLVPRQLIAVCVLALTILIPSVLNVISNTPIVSVDQNPMYSVATISKIGSVSDILGASIAQLPSKSIESYSTIGNSYLLLYQMQGAFIYQSILEISQIGDVVLFGYELTGDSFWQGFKNVLHSYSAFFSSVTHIVSKNIQIYTHNVSGGYTYIAYEFFQVITQVGNLAGNTYDFVASNIFNNVNSMYITANSLIKNTQASVNLFIEKREDLENPSNVIFVK
jgi:hypothetical protein